MIKKIIMITVLVLLSACGGRNEYIVETIPDRKIEATERPRNYIGNRNTFKFHIPSCVYLPFEENREYFSRREEAIKAGFEPCKKCNP